MSTQTVQTQIRLLLEEQSDQVLHCLPFHMSLVGVSLQSDTNFLHFRIITVVTKAVSILDVLR